MLFTQCCNLLDRDDGKREPSAGQRVVDGTRYSTTAASTKAKATAHKTIAGTSLTVFPYAWEPLPVIVRARGLFDESGPRVCLALAAREVRPATLQRCVETTPVMVAVYFSVRSVRFSVTFHQYRTRFHFFNQPPIRLRDVLSQEADRAFRKNFSASPQNQRIPLR